MMSNVCRDGIPFFEVGFQSAFISTLRVSYDCNKRSLDSVFQTDLGFDRKVGEYYGLLTINDIFINVFLRWISRNVSDVWSRELVRRLN